LHITAKIAITEYLLFFDLSILQLQIDLVNKNTNKTGISAPFDTNLSFLS